MRHCRCASVFLRAFSPVLDGGSECSTVLESFFCSFHIKTLLSRVLRCFSSLGVTCNASERRRMIGVAPFNGSLDRGVLCFCTHVPEVHGLHTIQIAPEQLEPPCNLAFVSTRSSVEFCAAGTSCMAWILSRSMLSVLLQIVMPSNELGGFHCLTSHVPGNWMHGSSTSTSAGPRSRVGDEHGTLHTLRPSCDTSCFRSGTDSGSLLSLYHPPTPTDRCRFQGAKSGETLLTVAGRERGEGMMPPSGWDVSRLSVGDRIGKDTFLRVSYRYGFFRVDFIFCDLSLLCLFTWCIATCCCCCC